MTDANETLLASLEANANRTPEEEAARVALLELDEREETKVEKDQALADAIANNPTPTPDPVVAAHQAVVEAQAALDKAQADADAAVAALITPPAPPADVPPAPDVPVA